MKKALLLFCSLLIAGCSVNRPLEDGADKYRVARQELFDTVFAQRPGQRIRLTEDEDRVARRLAELKLEVYSRGGHEWPARPIWEVKERLESTQLFAFLRAMPKGGLLHAHAGALGDMEWLISALSERDDAYIFRGDSETVPRSALILSQDHPGTGWVSLAAERAGDPAAFDAEQYRELTLGADDAGLSVPWQEFSRKFGMIRGLYRDPEIMTGYMRDAFEFLLGEDHLLYAEIRAGLRPDFLKAIGRLRSELRKTWPDFDLRIIINVSRYQAQGESKAEARRRYKGLMRTTAELVRDEESLVVGFDLVAEEDGGLPTAFFVETLTELREEGFELPLYLHAGESSRPGALSPRDCEYAAKCNEPLNNNLFDAVLLGARRIGHGLALAELPALTAEVRRRGIAVEVCPISNQLLGYVPDLRNHPAVTLLNAGVPLALCSDDPGLFQYQGMSYDFWMATVAWNLELGDLKQLARHSLLHSALPKREKARMVQVWERQWDRFIEQQATEGR